MNRILVGVLLYLPTSVFAIDAYKCTVTHTGALQDTGEFLETNYTKLYKGKEFIVDKGTGRMKGGLSNENSFGQPEVLDYGSRSQSFKALTIFRPAVTVNYLQIEEFNENPGKPFVFLDSRNVFSGVCKEY